MLCLEGASFAALLLFTAWHAQVYKSGRGGRSEVDKDLSRASEVLLFVFSAPPAFWCIQNCPVLWGHVQKFEALAVWLRLWLRCELCWLP